MLLGELGDIVDHNLIVYGHRYLRAVDESIFYNISYACFPTFSPYLSPLSLLISCSGDTPLIPAAGGARI